MIAGKPKTRCGISLLEVTLAMGLTGTLLLPVVGLLHTTTQVWAGHNSAHTTNMYQNSVVRQIVTHVRETDSVLQLSVSTLRLRLRDGRTVRWVVRGRRLVVDEDGKKSVLLPGFDSLAFFPMRSDGVTPAVPPTTAAIVRIGINEAKGGLQSAHEVKAWIRRWGS